MKTRFAQAMVIIALLTCRAHSDTVELAADQDGTLYEKNDGSLANGSGEFLFVGNTAQGNDENTRRTLIRFDVSGIPDGSTINSVVLQLYVSRVANNNNRTASLHRVTQDWGEGASDAPDNEGAGTSAEQDDATWLYRFYDPGDPESSPAWTNSGGDFSGTVSDARDIGGNGSYSWGSTPQMVADVEAWLLSPSTNFGWILIGDETTEETAKRLNSRQNTGQSTRLPKLTVDFTPGVPTGACCLPSGDCVVVTSESDCTNQMGTFEGFGSDCGTVVCPQPTGACCLSGGICNELTEADCLTQMGAYQGDFTDCDPNPCPFFLEPFVDELPIPAVATPVSGTAGGVATYDMAMREIQQQLHRDLPPTTMWGYGDGPSGATSPGPSILATADSTVTVNWINDLRYFSGPNQGELRQEHYLEVDLCPHGPNNPDNGNKARTVVHLHGAHVQSRFDGYPEETFLPGEQVQYVYPNNQVGGSLWFHDHALGTTRLNVMMGLAGAYVLRDQTELDLTDGQGDQIPSGEFDIPLVIQDRTFDDQGQLVYPAVWQDHFFGEFVMVNAKVNPFLQVKRGKYRFRMLNGSNSRVYTLALSNGAPFTVIGTDGGLLDAPVPDVPAITLGPGERAEVVVDFEPFPNGTEIILTNSEIPPLEGTIIPEIMKFVVQGGGGFTDPLPAMLRDNEVLQEGDAVMTRDFELRKDPDSTPDCSTTWWLINGLEWDDITEYPELDTIEIWRFNNPSGQVHPMHMHLVFFQVLDRTPLTGSPAGTLPLEPTEGGWKDTVRVGPNESVRVIARFEDYAGKYAYHCHILEHEDHEMMRQFLAVQPCPADTDRSGAVNTVDLLNVLAFWGECPEPCSDLGEIQEPADTCPGDINRDCHVDTLDLLALLAGWGVCP